MKSDKTARRIIVSSREGRPKGWRTSFRVEGDGYLRTNGRRQYVAWKDSTLSDAGSIHSAESASVETEHSPKHNARVAPQLVESQTPKRETNTQGKVGCGLFTLFRRRKNTPTDKVQTMSNRGRDWDDDLMPTTTPTPG